MAVVLGESSGRDRTLRAQSLLEHGFQTREWRGFFQKTASIDTLPDTGAAAGVTSVRQAVMNFACGNRRHVVRTVAAREKAKVARVKAKAAKTAEGAASPTAAPAPAQAGVAPVTPKPKPKAAVVATPKAAPEPKPQ